MLMAQLPLLLCFQISQLLAFYQRTISTMLGSRCQLADTLAITCKLARRVFAEQLKARGDKLLRYPPKPPLDLSPPPQVGVQVGMINEFGTCAAPPPSSSRHTSVLRAPRKVCKFHMVAQIPLAAIACLHAFFPACLRCAYVS